MLRIACCALLYALISLVALVAGRQGDGQLAAGDVVGILICGLLVAGFWGYTLLH